MSKVEIAKDIYWVGVVDWNVRNFHGHTYTTSKGTSYNAYLIIDDKVTLIDTVFAPFGSEMIENISKIISPEKISYIVVNHVETDHSGALPQILKLCPQARVIGTAKCKEGLSRHYSGIGDLQIVKTGDTVNIGKKNLMFIEAPMLHWPDSMFTYIKEDAILFPNDAFGQHYASSFRFDDEVDMCALMDEAAKYYANILWPFSGLVLRKIEEIVKMNIPLKIIAPSHGIIWRKEPSRIVDTYSLWAGNKTKNKVVIVYETMWGSTEKMAKKIAEGLIDNGVEVKIYNIAESDRTEVFKEMLDAKGFIIGSSTHDNDMLPNIAAFMELLKGFKPKNRLTCAFGSYGWAGGAVREIEDILIKAGMPPVKEGLSFKFVPDSNDLLICYNYGKDFAVKLLE